MIGLFAATPEGRAVARDLATQLGPEAVVADGPPGPALRRVWAELDVAVLLVGTDSAVRFVGGLLRDGRTDPAVVSVDEARRFAVALAGDDAGTWAERVAEVLGVVPVVSADSSESTVLDEVVELLDATVDGDLAACGEAVLNGHSVLLDNPFGFPLPALPGNVRTAAENPVWTVVVDDRRPREPESRTLRLIPRTLVVGVGAGSGVSRETVTQLVARLDREHGLDPRALRAFATTDRKAAEPGILEAVRDAGFWHGAEGDELPLLHYPAARLDDIAVPSPSSAVHDEVGTASVAEAAALHAAGQFGRAELAVRKLTGQSVGDKPGGHATVAAARVLPRGRLAIVESVPPEFRTPRAEIELRRSSVVVCSRRDAGSVRHLLVPGTEVRELDTAQARAAEAVALAGSGLAVALVGPGAPSREELDRAGAEAVVVPSAGPGSHAAARLGLLPGDDRVVLELTGRSWDDVQQKVHAAATGDLVVCFEAPEPGLLARALPVLAEHRPAETPVGAVGGPYAWWAPLGEFVPNRVDSGATVVAGSSRSIMDSSLRG